MSTQAQIAANQANAQLSTGPRTTDGKARSSHNALKHALTSTSPVLPTEDPPPFQEFQVDIHQHLNPESSLQTTLAQQIIPTAWQLKRISESESRTLSNEKQRLENEQLQDWTAHCTQCENLDIPHSPRPS